MHDNDNAREDSKNPFYLWDIWCDTDDKGRVTGWGLAKLYHGLRDDPRSRFLAIRWKWRLNAQRHADLRNKEQRHA